jgi:hypothetical protein
MNTLLPVVEMRFVAQRIFCWLPHHPMLSLMSILLISCLFLVRVWAFTHTALNAALAAAQAPALGCGNSANTVGSSGTWCSCLSAYHVYQCASHEPRQLQLTQGNGSLDLSGVPTLESVRIFAWSSLPKLVVTGLTRLTHLSVELSALPTRDDAANALFLDEIVGLESLCRLGGRLRTLHIKLVGLRQLDLTGCAQLESLDLFGLMRLTRFSIGATPSLAVAEVANVFAADDSARQQLQAHPSLFYLQYTENPHQPTAAVTDGWRGFVCRVNPTAPMFTKPGGLCNLGRVCHFNAGNCAACGVTAESVCATGRFCPPPTVAASRCTKGVEYDVAFELFNAATPTSDDHVCIKLVQTIHGKANPVDGAECKIAQIDTSVKGVAVGLAGVTFSSCSFQFSDDRTRVVSLELTSDLTRVRLGTAGFECGARFSVVSATATYAGNTTTFAGRVVGTGTASALAVEDMTIASDSPDATTPTPEPLNRAAIGLAVVLVAVLAVWLISCAVLSLRLRRARESAAAHTREMQSVPSDRRQRRRRSSRRAIAAEKQ